MIDGKVKEGRRTSDGRECLFDVVGPAEVFGETSVIEAGPRTAFACAVTEVIAWSVSRAELMAQIAIRRSSINITDVIGSDVSARVARQLLRLAQQFGVQHDGLTWMSLELTQEQLAQLVGAARESVNKTLGSFAQQGWIANAHDGIAIRESELLSRHAREK